MEIQIASASPFGLQLTSAVTFIETQGLQRFIIEEEYTSTIILDIVNVTTGWWTLVNCKIWVKY